MKDFEADILLSIGPLGEKAAEPAAVVCTLAELCV
jgi:hypothetical protein